MFYLSFAAAQIDNFLDFTIRKNAQVFFWIQSMSFETLFESSLAIFKAVSGYTKLDFENVSFLDNLLNYLICFPKGSLKSIQSVEIGVKAFSSVNI